MQTRSIEIDIDVHRHIESKRTSFVQQPNDILRSLFGFGDYLLQTGLPVEKASSSQKSNCDWSSKGVTLPAGTELRMTYNGRTHTGNVADGAWHISGVTYTSPSSAADALARSRDGRRVSLNGWTLWEVRKPGSRNWIKLDDLRHNDAMTQRFTSHRVIQDVMQSDTSSGK